MELYSLIKTLHILSSTVLLGTGIGIAFFMFSARHAQSTETIVHLTRYTVLADWCFTLPAVVLQPLTGLWLIWQSSFGFSEDWLIITYALYILAGICWIPVVFIQMKMHRLALHAKETNEPLDQHFYLLFKRWFWLGWPAFSALVVILLLMVIKPDWY